MHRIGYLIAVLVFIADQVSKPWILSVFEANPRPIEVTGFFNLVLVYNRGVSFGLFSNDSAYGPFILAGMAVVIAGLIWHFLFRRAEYKLMVFACALVIGGAFGNALDRVLYGAVVDFLDFHAMGYHWPAFNIADCAIVCGAVLIAFDGLFGRPKPLN